MFTYLPHSTHLQEEGTLIGTAFGMCFTYWIGSSSFVWFVCYVCNVGIAILQVLSMIVSLPVIISFMSVCLSVSLSNYLIYVSVCLS